MRAIEVIKSYATKLGLPTALMLLRLDGLYGDAAPLIDVLTANLGVIGRSRDYSLLDLEMVQQALAHPPDQVGTHLETSIPLDTSSASYFTGPNSAFIQSRNRAPLFSVFLGFHHIRREVISGVDPSENMAIQEESLKKRQ
ncbi:hypothetical protein KSF_101540 [Reticulibacter mediterranei]|uniref:Uncharacterized protein n=1 Tax=Reticulibacter mediterranei TaxID=2778369 RepID=A0A8J3ISR4_9CHLR|nr:hypothetical protein KSF_101540 [Reticulibacter mediterranei]